MAVRRTAMAGLLIALTALSLGCDNGEKPAPERPSWAYRSDKAPYAIEIPGQWRQEEAEGINRFADLAVSLEDQFFVIVIPQKLPQYEGIEPADALALKEAGVSLMQDRVAGLQVEREGPIELDGERGVTVFAEGSAERARVQYITTYVTRGGWGYQIVAWGPRDMEEGLVAATDALLAGWEFTDAAGPAEPPATPDAGGDDKAAAEQAPGEAAPDTPPAEAAEAPPN